MVHQFHTGSQGWHDALLAAILTEKAAKGSSHLVVARGSTWSGRKVFQDNPAAKGLKGLFLERLHELTGSEAWDLTLWPNVTHEGGSCGLHNHNDGSNVWSGVYYLTEGAPIVFPREGLTVEPEPGLMLLFASTEHHSVNPQVSAAPRVSIAMNARSMKAD